MLATAADIVADPSAPDALLRESWKEKIGYGMENPRERYAEKTYKQINTLVDQSALKRKS